MEYSTVSKNSWHYKFIDKIIKRHSSYYIYPRSECTYFWVVVLLMMCYPFYSLSYNIVRKLSPNSTPATYSDLSGVISMIFLSSFVSLSGILSVPLYIEMFTDLVLYPATENIVLFSIMTFMMIIGATGVIFQIFVVFTVISYGIGCLISTAYHKFREFKKYSWQQNNPKSKKDSLFSHFKQWATSKKKKLCKPIKYED